MVRRIRRSVLRGSDPGVEISRLIWEQEHGSCREVIDYTHYWSAEPTTRWVRPDGSICTGHREFGQPIIPVGNVPTDPKVKSECHNPTSARERKARARKQTAARKRGSKSSPKASK